MLFGTINFSNYPYLENEVCGLCIIEYVDYIVPINEQMMHTIYEMNRDVTIIIILSHLDTLETS